MYKSFINKLIFYLGPPAALFALPLAVLVRSWELAPVTTLARKHASMSPKTVYGPAYGNPDKGYKLAGIELRQPMIVGIGTSRIMQIRSDFFKNGERSFYNGGGSITRIYDYRLLFRRLQPLKTRKAIIALDHWMFNEHWSEFSPDPGVQREYDGDYSALDVIQRSLRVYSDAATGRLDLGLLFSNKDGLGVNGITRGNGFLRDGSYRYEDILRSPETAADYQFKDTLERIQTSTRRFEDGATPSPRALAELDALAAAWKNMGFDVIAFLPPFAPSVISALRDTGRHAYMFQIAEPAQKVLAAHDIPLIDFTTCGEVHCVDADFVDGFHGGTILYGRMMMSMATQVPWLAQELDGDALKLRLDAPHTSWELDE